MHLPVQSLSQLDLALFAELEINIIYEGLLCCTHSAKYYII